MGFSFREIRFEVDEFQNLGGKFQFLGFFQLHLRMITLNATYIVFLQQRHNLEFAIDHLHKLRVTNKFFRLLVQNIEGKEEVRQLVVADLVLAPQPLAEQAIPQSETKANKPHRASTHLLPRIDQSASMFVFAQSRNTLYCAFSPCPITPAVRIAA